MLGTLLLALLMAGPPEPGESAKPPGVAVEVQCVDGSSLHARVLDEQLELVTRYGTLRIPTRQIARIELATRIPPEVEAKITAAVKNLGHPDFKTRDRATTELKTYRDRAYPALSQAAKSSDSEVARRSEELIATLRAKYSATQLEPRDADVVHTADSRIAGKLSTATLRVLTTQFGEQVLKLSDARELRMGTTVVSNSGAIPAPGNLMAHQNQLGTELQLQVTGTVGGSVWGTDVYTLDSSVGCAAVHAGLVQPGQIAVVKVRIVQSLPQFLGSTRNGVTSSAYGVFVQGAFMFVR